VACPWFEPVSIASGDNRPQPARAPLGKVFRGLCHAHGPAGPCAPDESVLFEACNFGYGRGSCSQFPTGGDADAVRFSQHDGKLIWILEKNYAPLRFGVVDAACEGLLMRQAEAFKQTHG
jgi:hypothetical protein